MAYHVSEYLYLLAMFLLAAYLGFSNIFLSLGILFTRIKLRRIGFALKIITLTQLLKIVRLALLYEALNSGIRLLFNGFNA